MQKESWLQDLGQDVRIGLRSLLRVPMLMAAVVATVGLGIGATTAMFGVVDAALLRPLPYAEPDRLVRIYTDAPPNKFPFSVADYLALEEQQKQFERVAGLSSRAMAFSDGSVAERLQGRLVTWSYFGLLGVRPAHRPGLHGAGRPAGQPPDRHRQPRVLATTARRAAGRDRTADTARWLGVSARGRPAAAAGPTGAGTGLLRGRAMGHAAAQGAVLHHGGRASPPRRGSIGRGGRAADHQPAHVSGVASLLSGREGLVGPDGPEGVRDPRRRHGREPGAGGRGSGVADRLRQRLQPVDRARDEPPPRAGGAVGARGLARARGPLPAGGKRPARAGCRGRGPAAGLGRHRPAAEPGGRLHPARPGDRARRAGAVAVGRLDGRQRTPVRTRPGAAWDRRSGGRVVERPWPVVDGQRQGPSPAPRARRRPVRRRDAAARRGGAACGYARRAQAGRSRLRQPQPADRRHPPPGVLLQGRGQHGRLLGRAEAAGRGPARGLGGRVRGWAASQRRRQPQQLQPGGGAHAAGADPACHALGGGVAGVLSAARPHAAARDASSRSAMHAPTPLPSSSSIGPGQGGSSRTGGPSASACARVAARTARGRPWWASSAR